MKDYYLKPNLFNGKHVLDMNISSNIKVLYLNVWLKGDWQVQKIHALEFLEAFQRQPGIQVFAFPQISTSKKESIHDKRKKQFLDLTKQFIKRTTPSFLKWVIDKISYKKNSFKIINYINKLQPDLMIVRHNAIFFPIMHNLLKPNLPLILEANSLVTQDLALANIKVPSRISKLEKDIIHRSDALFTVCRPISETIKDMGVDPEKIFTIPNGVNPTKFSPQPKSDELCTKYGLSKSIVVGYVGGFVKGQPEGRDVLGMLEAFKIAQNRSESPLKMLMVGRMDEECLWKEIKKIGIDNSVVFTGLIDHSQVPQFINLIDIAVAPYLERHLKYRSPIKLFEYMAMEKPTIIPRIGQAAEILTNNETAVLVKPESPISMAEALLRLLQNKFLRKNIGRNARKLILDKYTWEHNARNIANICHLVLKKHRLKRKK